MMANSFETARNTRQQHLKDEVTASSVEQKKQSDGDPLGLTSKKRTRQTYTVYLDRNLMNQAQQFAKRRGVSTSIFIEACLKKVLNEMDLPETV